MTHLVSSPLLGSFTTVGREIGLKLPSVAKMQSLNIWNIQLYLDKVGFTVQYMPK